MRRKERNTTIHIWLWAILFVLVMASSGCGLVADGVNHIRAIQFDPGDLYSPEFYETAMPEEVKAAIGGRSLAEESFRVKWYEANTEGRGLMFRDLDEKINQITSVFIPMSSVEVSSPVYPLTVALWHSPHPEVIRIMLDAGADVRTVRVSEYVISGGAKDDVSKMLLERASPGQRCGSLIAFALSDRMAMVEYALGLEGVDINCESNGNSPISVALMDERPDMAAFLLERGARLPANPAGEYAFLRLALRPKGMAVFRFLLEKGLDPAKAADPHGSSLLKVAQDRGVEDEDVLLLLARTVPLDGKAGETALKGAAGLKNAKILDVVLQRFKKSGIRDGGGPALLAVALRGHDADLFRRLAALGADASQVDASGRNELMRVAYQNFRDREILQLLAGQVPLDGRNGEDALWYAVESGYAEPVRILLERGAVPGTRGMRVPQKAEDGESIRAMLRERGFL